MLIGEFTPQLRTPSGSLDGVMFWQNSEDWNKTHTEHVVFRKARFSCCYRNREVSKRFCAFYTAFKESLNGGGGGGGGLPLAVDDYK